MNPLKCRGPAQVLAILGLRFDARRRHVSLPEEKRHNYLNAVRAALAASLVKSKSIEKLIGYLLYAS